TCSWSATTGGGTSTGPSATTGWPPPTSAAVTTGFGLSPCSPTARWWRSVRRRPTSPWPASRASPAGNAPSRPAVTPCASAGAGGEAGVDLGRDVDVGQVVEGGVHRGDDAARGGNGGLGHGPGGLGGRGGDVHD